MSISLMTAVWVLPVPPARKLVLLALADWADDDGGQCFPSIATVATRASISDRQAQRHIRALMRDGWVASGCRARGGRRSRRYQLAAQRIYAALAATRAAKGAVNDTCVTPPANDTCVAPEVTPGAPRGDVDVTRSTTIHHRRSSSTGARAAAWSTEHGVTCWTSATSDGPADIAALVAAHGVDAVEAAAKRLSDSGVDPLPSVVSAALLAAAAERTSARRRVAATALPVVEDAATAEARATAQMAAYAAKRGGA
jgi:hypothetical protein